MLRRFFLLLDLSRYHFIGRRYFIVNGFDGALTMLGILLGFYQVGNTTIPMITGACLGAAIALGVSGFSSAYISESAERQKELKELESAMATSLEKSAHAQAARLSPALIALINGSSPLLLSLIIMLPLWFTAISDYLVLSPIESAISVALFEIFSLGIYLGKISGQFWLLSGFRTLLIALITGVIIYLLIPK